MGFQAALSGGKKNIACLYEEERRRWSLGKKIEKRLGGD